MYLRRALFFVSIFCAQKVEASGGKGGVEMFNLTTKELSGLEDQLGFEKMMCCKYQEAAQSVEDVELKNGFNQYARQHRQNYETLLEFLK